MHILSALPEHHALSRGISIARLTALLEAAGLPCDKRTVQRDMAEMSRLSSVWYKLGLRLTNDDPPKGVAASWRHAPGSKTRFLSTISHEYALLLSLSRRELQALLPQSIYERIQEPLDSAAQMLDHPHYASHARYLDSIRVLPDGPQRDVPPPTAILGKINDALLNCHQLELRYASAKGGEKTYRLHPVGMVQKGLYHWLLAVKDADDPQLLRSVQSYRHDRMRSVALLPHEPLARKLPTLEQAMSAGRHEFMNGGLIHLKLRFIATNKGRELCVSFRNAPLGIGQVITANADGSHELSTTVHSSLQLDWLLQRYADRIKVIEPQSLSKQLREFALAAAALQAET